MHLNQEFIPTLAVSWALFTLIWIVQLVHYPAFFYVDMEMFTQFHIHHARSIGIVVMPLMLLELGLTAWLAVKYHFGVFFML